MKERNKHHIIIAATSHLNRVIQADPLHVLGDTIRTHVAGYQFDYIPHPVLTMYYIIGSVTHSPGAPYRYFYNTKNDQYYDEPTESRI